MEEKKPKFCDECGEDGLLELCWSDNEDGSRTEWYECLNCGKGFTIEQGKN